jgi:hypothetical protein
MCLYYRRKGMHRGSCWLRPSQVEDRWKPGDVTRKYSICALHNNPNKLSIYLFPRCWSIVLSVPAGLLLRDDAYVVSTFLLIPGLLLSAVPYARSCPLAPNRDVVSFVVFRTVSTMLMNAMSEMA